MRTRTLANYEIRAPGGLETRFGTFDTADWVWNGICGAGILYASLTEGIASLLLVATALIWAVGAYRLLNGRVYQLVLDELTNLWYLVIKKGVVWQRTARHPYPKWPFSTIISIDENGTNRSIALVGKDGMVAVFLVGTGWEYATDNLVTQRVQMDELATRLRSFTGVGVSWVYLNRPLDLWPSRNFEAEALAPEVFMPRRYTDTGEVILEPNNDTLRNQYLHDLAVERQQVNENVGRDSTAVLVVLIPAKLTGNRQELAKNKTGEITKQELQKDRAIRIAYKVVLALKKYGVPDARIATAIETASILRMSLDGKSRDFYDLVHERGNEVVKDMLFLPQEHIIGTRNHVKVDNGYLGFIRPTAMPEIVTPLSFSPLFGVKNDEKKPISLAVTVLGTAVSGKGESRWLDRLILVREAFLSLFGGSYRNAESREARAENEERKRELVKSGYRRYDFLPFVTVHAADPEQLEEHIRCVSEAMDRLGLEPKQVHGVAQQKRALKSTPGVCFM